MKAKCHVYRQQELGIRADSSKIGKSKGDDVEMQACFSKLRQIVPTVSTNQRLSKVQLLQHVIDYITDLELTLDHPPSFKRQPLCEATHLNTMVSEFVCFYLNL